MSVQVEFNINNYVLVRLTDAGREEHRRQYEEFVEGTLNLKCVHGYVAPKEDEEGWSRWQLWHLMNKFGHMTHLGGEPPFDTTIRIESEQTAKEAAGL